MQEKKCPCENCICIAICQSKEYVNLVEQCSLLTKYLIDPCNIEVRPIDRLQKVKELLNPTFWDYEIETRSGTKEKFTWVTMPNIKHEYINFRNMGIENERVKK